MTEGTNDPMVELHEATTLLLLKRVKDGSATAADLNVARQWLRDHDTLADPKRHKGLRELAGTLKDLPFQPPQD